MIKKCKLQKFWILFGLIKAKFFMKYFIFKFFSNVDLAKFKVSEYFRILEGPIGKILVHY